MAKLKVMCARSMHVAVGALGQAFGQAAGHDVEFDFGTVGALQAKLDAGENADVLILSVAMIDRLERTGALVPRSRTDLAKTFIALCVPRGAPIPDFSTADTFRRLLENARTIAISDPAVGGSAGVHLAKAFDVTGLAPMMTVKALPQTSGVEVARRVVEGKAEFGLTLSAKSHRSKVRPSPARCRHPSARRRFIAPLFRLTARSRMPPPHSLPRSPAPMRAKPGRRPVSSSPNRAGTRAMPIAGPSSTPR